MLVEHQQYMITKNDKQEPNKPANDTEAYKDDALAELYIYTRSKSQLTSTVKNQADGF